MNKIKALILIIMSNLIYSSSAYAFPCDLTANNTIKTEDQLFQFDHSVCRLSNNADSIPFLQVKDDPYSRSQRFNDWKQDQVDNTSEFWNHWSDDFADHPVFTEYNDSMYYGLGFWLPRQYDNENVEDIVDAEQWVLNHGVQMSLGFGDPNDDSTRVRLDYRWHTKSSVDDGISVQVHVPLN
ncbi:hypothetical protein C9I86_02695 [Photobacterium sp. NCIMB 13483]|nr:hypothetical protein C9I86_02695 [Photobacterium sp. NCIMB 13483]